MPDDRQQQAAEFEEDYFTENEREYLKSQLARFREYTSFTTLDNAGQQKVYDLYMPETATGLLRDVIAKTSQLTPEQRVKKAVTLEAFAAYCMYICATRCARWVNVGEAIPEVYLEMVEWLKNHLENGNMKSFHSYLARRARWRYRDILKKGGLRMKGSKGKPVPLREDGTIETDDKELRDKYHVKIAAEAARAMVLEIDRVDVNRAIDVCFEQGKLTKDEVKILCHMYGLGDGYKLLSQTEIARKLKKSDAYVSRHLYEALNVLRDSDMLPPIRPGVFSDSDSESE